ncbi:MAG: hypothetical protein JWP97_4310 [Labilithrix sp.]|nr:hypothetical protein [Labilithrix sp.]
MAGSRQARTIEGTMNDLSSSSSGTATMRDARARYFTDNGFGDDGGYADAWVDFQLGPLSLPFPNTPGRIAAVKFHDLHHVLTGYPTDARGEFQISAWEIGAGCTRMPTAWVINSGGMFAGVLSAPRRTFRSFVRGRHSRSLYGETFEPLLDQHVDELRERFVAPPETPATVRDVGAFAMAASVGLVVGAMFLAITLPLVPVGLAVKWMKDD